MLKIKAAAAFAIFFALFLTMLAIQLRLIEDYSNPLVIKPVRQISEMEVAGSEETWHIREPVIFKTFEPREYVKIISRPQK
ncbi:hypothetical protein [Metabacillus sp. 84]|uniref:hypothetical protein n=1 Tax=unclassified Metabacillus TaxID=2675274 RepID=UPI003CF89094